MASNIDPTKPINSEGFAGDLRANLAAAKDEIEALQDEMARKIVWAGNATGTPNLITLSPSPALSAYFGGLLIVFIATANSTGAVTINVNSLGERALRRGNEGLLFGEITAGHAVFAAYDSGSNVFRLIGISGNLAVRSAGGNPQLRVQAEGDITPEIIFSRANGSSHTDRDWRLQIQTNGNFTFRDNTSGTQRIEFSTDGHLLRASQNPSGQLGTISRRWAQIFGERIEARASTQNPAVTVEGEGDVFPLVNIIRTSGNSFVNRHWQLNINSFGGFVVRDQTSGVNMVTLNTDGSLDIGEPVRSRRFIAAVTGENQPALELVRTSGGSATNRDWRVQCNLAGSFIVRDETAGVRRLEIGTNGNVLPGDDNAQNFGSLTLRWQALHAVNGTIQTSDEREKTDIEDSALGLDFIERLRPVSYRWADGPDGALHYGFIGQQMEAALEGAEFGGLIVDENGRYSVGYVEVLAPLVSAVQTLLGMVRELQAEVAELKRS